MDYDYRQFDKFPDSPSLTDGFVTDAMSSDWFLVSPNRAAGENFGVLYM